MIIAPHPAGAVAVLQTDHAVMCAELADLWASLAEFPAADDIRLAAEKHELGWIELDATPRLNPDTGLPFSVFELPFRNYLDSQVAGPRALGGSNAYAGLLASIHHAGFYRRPSARGLVTARGRHLSSFFAETTRLQTELAARAGVAVADSRTVRDARLVRGLDGLSHDLLLERAPCTRREVPLTPTDFADLRLDRQDDSLTVTPWPFGPGHVEVHARGRLLRETYASESELHAALAAAETVTLSYRIVQRS